MLRIFIAAEWWFMYGNHTPTLRNLAIKVLSQTTSSSACERNWSAFALIHTKQRNWLAYPRLQQLVFCYYNMKLKICVAPLSRPNPFWRIRTESGMPLKSLNHSKSYLCGSDLKFWQAHKHLHYFIYNLTKYIYNEGIQAFSK